MDYMTFPVPSKLSCWMRCGHQQPQCTAATVIITDSTLACALTNQASPVLRSAQSAQTYIFVPKFCTSFDKTTNKV